MTTDSTKAMTLEQVIATLEARDLFAEASFIKALLAPREVSDEDVERAKAAYRSSAERDNCPFPVLIAGLRDVIQADRQRGYGVVPSERVYAPLPSDADEYDRGHVDGWNACREALLAQRGQVREFDRKAFAFDALVAAGFVTEEKAAEALALFAPDADAEGNGNG